ncbi:MAG: divalent-cation tolerance protein CutA [Verrucomicrobiae bacterium]|nr:divalent-cation tolerance protein CutA [Verrucomicrobiae bacterium]
MTSMILLMTTFADEVTAAATVRKLVEESLVACGTIIPKAKSIYSWQGKIEESNEVVVFLKTTQALQSTCMKRLKALHSYEVPEIIAIEPTAVSELYAAWIENSLLLK